MRAHPSEDGEQQIASAFKRVSAARRFSGSGIGPLLFAVDDGDGQFPRAALRPSTLTSKARVNDGSADAVDRHGDVHQVIIDQGAGVIALDADAREPDVRGLG